MSDIRRPEIHAITEINWWQMVLRFLFGAVITGVATVVILAWGARAAGPLLAFPSILPAALTFLQEKDGKDASLSDLSGAALGAVALAAFALLMFLLADRVAGVVAVAVSSVGWTVIGLGLWVAFRRTAPLRDADIRDQRSTGRRRPAKRQPAHGS